VLTAYTTAKHAINGMTKSVAREVGTQGITVNAICPGLVITDIVRDNGPKTAEAMGMSFDEMVALFSKEAAIERPNTVEEVAAVAVLLASDLGGGITGALLSVDGGTAQY
jgi:3-hydroxybutyrate dehydrogenase/3-oxoacyl-[acyl-carrier protein] reductase